MEAFLNFFELMPAWQKGVVVVCVLLICWLLENRIPLFRMRYNKIRHGSINLFFFLGVSVVNLIFGLILVNTLWYFEQYEFGLLFRTDLPVWVELVVSILLLDLVAQYAVHVCLHKVPWMWRLHMVHHSDTRLDATSGTRHHPGDYALRECFSFAALAFLGIPVSHYFAYRFLTIFFTYINHANIRLPNSLSLVLSLVFVTPDLHKIHHHYRQPWTDSNYGNIFSIWDRIFGTLVAADSRKVVYGLDSLGTDYKDSVGALLWLPFGNGHQGTKR